MGNNGGHVLRETTSRGLCGLVCPSRISERGGEGYCVKEGGGEEGERVSYGCSNNENEDSEISRKGGRDGSCVADSEFATVHRVLINLIGRQ